MAEKQEKTLEMRLSELEDKMARMHVTEEEMKAYQKVSALAGGGAGGSTSYTPAPGPCAIHQCIISQCIISQCIHQCIIRQCTVVRQCTIVRQCTVINQCNECINECGPGLPGGGYAGGSGFGTMG